MRTSFCSVTVQRPLEPGISLSCGRPTAGRDASSPQRVERKKKKIMSHQETNTWIRNITMVISSNSCIGHPCGGPRPAPLIIQWPTGAGLYDMHFPYSVRVVETLTETLTTYLRFEDKYEFPLKTSTRNFFHAFSILGKLHRSSLSISVYAEGPDIFTGAR